jgi:surfeit locus 1 family protein
VQPLDGDSDTGSLRCNRNFALLVVLCLPLLIALGCWQLNRADQKTRILADYEQRSAADPLPLEAFTGFAPSALDGRRVLLRGRYLPEHSFLLDNRIFRGKVGYELISPFQERSGAVLLLNRGWLQAPPTRDQLPRIETPSGDLQLTGEFHAATAASPPPLLASAGWPRVVQAVDTAEMGRLAGIPAFACLVRVAADQPGASPADWARINLSPARHIAYAVQWFLLATGLLVVFVLGGTNLLDWMRNKQRRGHT